jgi:tRNA pseudouridine38-40 synthase
MSKRNVLLTIEYDGSGFHGWQMQPGVRTVQGVLTDALSRVTGEEIALNGSSRTDAGVHAYGAAASFTGDFGIPAERIPVAVNNMLTDVRITNAKEMPEGFHARFDAKGKTYLYRISAPTYAPAHTPPKLSIKSRSCNSPAVPVPVPDIFLRNYRYLLNEMPDEGKIKEAAKHFIGTHDFSAFRTASDSAPPDAVRTITALDVDCAEGRDTRGGKVTEITLRVTGDGFLYNMVRIIAGTIVEAGLGRRDPKAIADVVASGDRRLAGHTAPAAGLYLEKVYYDHDGQSE